MALQSFTITIGALTDAGNNGKNYVNNQPVYIKRTNGTLASIYRDLAGTSQINQDGLSNVTNSNGQFTFFVEAGDYIAEYDGQVTPITVVGPDYFNSRIDDVTEDLQDQFNSLAINFNLSPAGFDFATGGTLTSNSQTVTDGSGNEWIYTLEIPEGGYVVAAGTVPSEPTYKQVTYTNHNNASNRNAVGAHDDIYIRSLTTSSAILEDAPVGTRYEFTDLNNARYDVVDISDSGGYYIALNSTKKFKLIYSTRVDCGRLQCTLDGVTDNTAELLSFLNTLPADSTLSIYIPNNLKYDFNQIVSVLPLRCNVIDDSSVNGWDSVGFRQKVLQVYEKGDATGVVDLNQVLSSGHNASHVLENTGVSGSVSGDKRVVSWSWSSGRFQQDQSGLRLMARNEYAKSAVRDDIWAYTVRKRAPWLAKDYEIWRAGQNFSVDDVCLANSTKRFYKALNGGAAGNTEPNHTTGTASDGNITWEVLDIAAFDATVFYMDELGRVATNAGASIGFTQRWKQAVQDIENMRVAWEATGNSKSVRLSLRPTNGSGVAVEVPQLLASSSGGLRALDSGLTEEFFRLSDSRGFELGAYGHRELTVTDGNASPSVVGVGVVVFNNSSASNVTGFSDGKSTQEITVISSNSNTTLVNSSTLRLKGGVDAAVPAFGVLTFIRWSGSSAWIEKSRNF